MDLWRAFRAVLAVADGDAVFGADDGDGSADGDILEEPVGHFGWEADAAVGGWVAGEFTGVEAHGGGGTVVVEAHEVFHERAFEAGTGGGGVEAGLDIAHDGAAAAGDEVAVGGRAVVEVFLADGVVAGFGAVVFLAAGDGGVGGEAIALVEVGLLGVEVDDEGGVLGGEWAVELVRGEVEATGSAIFVEGVDGGAVLGADGGRVDVGPFGGSARGGGSVRAGAAAGGQQEDEESGWESEEGAHERRRCHGGWGAATGRWGVKWGGDAGEDGNGKTPLRRRRLRPRQRETRNINQHDRC